MLWLDKKPNRTAIALCQCHNSRKQIPLVWCRASTFRRFFVDPQETNSDNDHISITRGLKCADEVRQSMRVTDGHQDVVRTAFYLSQRNVRCCEKFEWLILV